MDIFVIEDNVFQRERVWKAVAQTVASENFNALTRQETITAEQLLQEKSLHRGPNIYVLDIDLHEHLNGIELGRKIRSTDTDVYIIYVTSHGNRLKEIIDEYIAPISFIPKADNHELTQEAIKKAFKQIAIREDFRNQKEEIFTIQRGSTQKKIPHRDILYFEKIPRSKKINLYTVNGVLMINLYLTQIKKELTGDQFIHLNSFIINALNIQEINLKEGFVEFTNHERLFVGKHSLRAIKKSLTQV
ncbi:LytR/AlgR family response regulator transcription factor [Listeria valentina]|uniref:LytR/AlgR family response regulator transcription factor n=1 Tax=Listeria valentina TaxID=2705293 RepID=UPI00142FDD5C|nr:LytTR family DNA-binding domain-containing protein [Listeria valentina]